MDRSSIMSVLIPSRNFEKIVDRLNDPNLMVSRRVGIIRISSNLYNNESDIWKLIESNNDVIGKYCYEKTTLEKAMIGG